MNSIYGFIVLGIVTGILSGFLGVGGGIIMVPALVFIFHFNQHQAQGMSLAAMLLPLGALVSVIGYYKYQPFPIKSALWITLGMLLGSWFGMLLAQQLPARTLRITFAVFMMITAIKMIASK